MSTSTTDPDFRTTTTEQDTPAKMIAIAIGVLSAGYFVPGSVATYRNTDNQALVWWLCALTSWTVIGWVVALIIAAQRTEKRRLSTEKNWPARHPALLAGAVVMVLGLVIGGVSNSATSGPTTNVAVPSGSGADPAPAPVGPDTEPVEQAEPEPAGPVVVLDASHSGAESTEDFDVTGRYEVDYSYDCQSDFDRNFALQMSDSSGFPVELLANEIGQSGSDSLSKRAPAFGSGPFYVESMLNGCDWTVKVTDLPD